MKLKRKTSHVPPVPDPVNEQLCSGVDASNKSSRAYNEKASVCRRRPLPRACVVHVRVCRRGPRPRLCGGSRAHLNARAVRLCQTTCSHARKHEGATGRHQPSSQHQQGGNESLHLHRTCTRNGQCLMRHPDSIQTHTGGAPAGIDNRGGRRPQRVLNHLPISSRRSRGHRRPSFIHESATSMSGTQCPSSPTGEVWRQGLTCPCGP